MLGFISHIGWFLLVKVALDALLIYLIGDIWWVYFVTPEQAEPVTGYYRFLKLLIAASPIAAVITTITGVLIRL